MTQQVVDGFQIEVDWKEVVDHLTAKADEHAAKANAYDKQIVELEALHEPGTYNSNDPRQSLGQSLRSHRSKAELFKFMADHVIMNVTYRLDEADLLRLEWMDRGY